MKFFKDFKSYYNYLLILLGLGVVSWIIWARFIRPRVPKNIPFELTEKLFCILLYICIIYFFMVYKLMRPGKPNEDIKVIVEFLFTPLFALDIYLKNHKYIKSRYLKIADKVIKVIQSYKIESKQIIVIHYIYVIFYIVPRMILVSILCLDIFYFHKLAWIYKIILLGMLPLLHRYMKYSIKYIKDQYIKDLEYNYKSIKLSDKTETWDGWTHDPEFMPYHDKYVSVKEYINIELEMREINDETIGYKACPFNQDYITLQYLREIYNCEDPKKLTYQDIDSLDKIFKQYIPIVLDLSIFLKNYSEVDYFYLIPKFPHILIIKHIKIIIFGLYFICWSYILIVSYPTLPYNAFRWLWIVQNIEDPFSFTRLIITTL